MPAATPYDSNVTIGEAKVVLRVRDAVHDADIVLMTSRLVEFKDAALRYGQFHSKSHRNITRPIRISSASGVAHKRLARKQIRATS